MSEEVRLDVQAMGRSRARVSLDYLRGISCETLSAADRAYLDIVWGGFGLPWEKASYSPTPTLEEIQKALEAGEK